MGKSIFSDDTLYDFYDIEIQFRDRTYGSLPKNRNLLEGWIEAKGEMPRETMEEKAEVLDLVEEVEAVSNAIRSDEKGLFLRDFMVEAMLKLCGSILGIFVTKRGSKGITQHGLHARALDEIISGERLYLYDEDGKHITEPDGEEDFAGTVQTPQGKRSVLKRCEFAEKRFMKFSIRLLKPEKQKKLTLDQVKDMFHLGQDNGLGACRSLGGGRFDVLKFEKRNGEPQ